MLPAVDLSAEDYTDATQWRKVNTVEVRAIERATLIATDQSITKGKGGVITTNQLQAQAIARIEDSTITATGDGDVLVDAQNIASLDASSLTKSGGLEVVGVVVAFNTIGWDASNILFQTLDALLGDSLLTGLFEDDQDGAQAFIQNSSVTATASGGSTSCTTISSSSARKTIRPG